MSRITAETYPVLHQLAADCGRATFESLSYSQEVYTVPEGFKFDLDSAEATASSLTAEDRAALVAASGDVYERRFLRLGSDDLYTKLDELISIVLD